MCLTKLINESLISLANKFITFSYLAKYFSMFCFDIVHNFLKFNPTNLLTNKKSNFNWCFFPCIQLFSVWTKRTANRVWVNELSSSTMNIWRWFPMMPYHKKCVDPESNAFERKLEWNVQKRSKNFISSLFFFTFKMSFEAIILMCPRTTINFIETLSLFSFQVILTQLKYDYYWIIHMWRSLFLIKNSFIY